MSETKKKPSVVIKRQTTVTVVINDQKIDITEEDAKALYEDLKKEFGPKDLSPGWKKMYEDLVERNRNRPTRDNSDPLPWQAPWYHDYPQPIEVWCGHDTGFWKDRIQAIGSQTMEKTE